MLLSEGIGPNVLGVELGAIHTPPLRVAALLKLGGVLTISWTRNPTEELCNLSQVITLVSRKAASDLKTVGGIFYLPPRFNHQSLPLGSSVYGLLPLVPVG